MKAQHTPGPWEAIEHIAINNVKGYRVFAGDDEITVCRNAAGGLGSVVQLPAEANARLIAAAPDLLEALEIVVSMEYDRDEESRNFEDERLEYFQQLITKATGEL